MEYHQKMTLIGCSCLIVGLVLALFLSCDEHNPVKPHPSRPVHPSEFIIYELVDLTVTTDVIIDRSGPNVYSNGIEEAKGGR